jgi:hypothetical protein
MATTGETDARVEAPDAICMAPMHKSRCTSGPATDKIVENKGTIHDHDTVQRRRKQLGLHRLIS